MAPGVQGFIALQRPLPPGCLVTIWNDQARYESSYLNQFTGYYVSGDGGYKDDEGYLFVMGRIDDVINVAGHRLSTGEMEAVLGGHTAVAECAVIGIQDELKGQIPLGLVVLKDGIYIDDDELEGELVAKIRSEIGPSLALKEHWSSIDYPKLAQAKFFEQHFEKWQTVKKCCPINDRRPYRAGRDSG